MEQKTFKGKEGLKSFLKETAENARNEKFTKALDYFYAGDWENAKNILLYVLDHPMNKDKLMLKEKNLFDDILILQQSEQSKNTDWVCHEGMRCLGIDADIPRAVRLSIGLQNLIRKEKRQQRTKAEERFIKVAENYLEINNKS